MDPRLEFTFQILIDATGLPRHEIMDHVFDGDMVMYDIHYKKGWFLPFVVLPPTLPKQPVHLEVNRYHFLYLPLQKIQLILR